jgi:hypothetical protein
MAIYEENNRYSEDRMVKVVEAKLAEDRSRTQPEHIETP